MKNEITITLPIPDAKFSPNARIHWAQKARLDQFERKSERTTMKNETTKKGRVSDKMNSLVRVLKDGTTLSTDETRKLPCSKCPMNGDERKEGWDTEFCTQCCERLYEKP